MDVSCNEDRKMHIPMGVSWGRSECGVISMKFVGVGELTSEVER